MKITRRELSATLIASTAAAAQTPATKPEEDLKAAKEQVQRNADALEQFELPIETEPAFTFRA